MTMEDVATAMQRVQTVLRRRPEFAIHDDPPATARWEDGTRVVARHANGSEVSTDMPGEIGGSGDQVSPGWLFRAGLASCAVTSIAMGAAADGIKLVALEIVASSRSDVRGLLRMPSADGAPVCAGLQDLQLSVRIAARDVAPDRLRSLVETGLACSPVYAALYKVVPMDLRIDVDAG